MTILHGSDGTGATQVPASSFRSGALTWPSANSPPSPQQIHLAWKPLSNEESVILEVLRPGLYSGNVQALPLNWKISLRPLRTFSEKIFSEKIISGHTLVDLGRGG